MNLLELLKKEIYYLNINNKKDIKDYIYLRTGQIFNYDPLYLFANNNERKKFRNERINMKNINNYEITCFSWATLYVELLKEFGIEAQVISNIEHATVLVYIDNEIYLTDLMNKHEDLMRIKFGMSTIFNIKISTDLTNLTNYLNNDTKMNNITKTEQKIINIKYELLKLKKEKNLDNDKYIYLVYKTIIQIMKLPRDNVGIVAANTFIKEIIQFFTDYLYYPNITYFYDKNKKIYIKLYSMYKDDNIHYFSSESVENKYSFQEKSINEINEFISKYSNIGINNLLIKKK